MTATATLLLPGTCERDVRAEPERASARTEEALCAAALRGDARAWSALVERHNHRVVLALLAGGVRADRARDVAQDAWVRLWEQQQRGRLSALVLPALAIAQARFVALEYARRVDVARPGVEEPALGWVPDPSPGAEARVAGGEQLRRAQAALDACHPTAQRVFRAVYEDPDKPHADVAREVGLSLQRVRQIVCEVRKKLRAVLEGDGHA